MNWMYVRVKRVVSCGDANTHRDTQHNVSTLENSQIGGHILGVTTYLDCFRSLGFINFEAFAENVSNIYIMPHVLIDSVGGGLDNLL